jgi:hypothetical protein
VSLPPILAEVLREVDTSFFPGLLIGDKGCQASAFHSPRPLVVNEVELVPWSHDFSISKKLWLCPTCAANLLVFQTILFEGNGKVDYKLAREFGNAIRNLGKEGWVIFEADLKAKRQGPVRSTRVEANE